MLRPFMGLRIGLRKVTNRQLFISITLIRAQFKFVKHR